MMAMVMAMLTAENRTREWDVILLSWCCGHDMGYGCHLSSGMSRDQSSEGTRCLTGATGIAGRPWEEVQGHMTFEV